MMEIVILQTTYSRELKIEDMPITQNHLDDHIQIMVNEDFTVEGQPGQIIGFITLINVITPGMCFMPSSLLLATQKHHHMPGEQFMRTSNYHLL